MVRLSPGGQHWERLDKLKKEKEEKEREIREKQEQKQRELNAIQESGQFEIEQANKKLEDAVATFISGSNDEDDSEIEPAPIIRPVIDEENLEQAIAQENEARGEDEEKNLSYEIKDEQSEKMAELYQGSIVEGEGQRDFYSSQTGEEFYSSGPGHLSHGDQRRMEEGDFYKSEMSVVGDLQRQRSGMGYKG